MLKIIIMKIIKLKKLLRTLINNKINNLHSKINNNKNMKFTYPLMEYY